MELEEQMFGKQMFAGPGRDSGTLSGLWSLSPAEFYPAHLARIFCRYFWQYPYSRNKPSIS